MTHAACSRGTATGTASISSTTYRTNEWPMPEGPGRQRPAPRLQSFQAHLARQAQAIPRYKHKHTVVTREDSNDRRPLTSRPIRTTTCPSLWRNIRDTKRIDPAARQRLRDSRAERAQRRSKAAEELAVQGGRAHIYAPPCGRPGESYAIGILHALYLPSGPSKLARTRIVCWPTWPKTPKMESSTRKR
eukprot:2580923-Pleurochrysis_carterae.AAC.3